MLYHILSNPTRHRKGHHKKDHHKRGHHSHRKGSHLTKGPTNIFETENDWSLEILAPGFQKSEISMKVEDNTLHISTPKSKDERTASIREYGPLTIKRSFKLPKNIDVEKINAQLEAGILKIVIPKNEDAKPRTINIK